MRMKNQHNIFNHDTVNMISLIGDREEQQDSLGIWYDENICIMVLADGAGGHHKGAQSSKITTDTFAELWSKNREELMETPLISLQKAMIKAHLAIIKETGNGIAAQSGKAAAVALLISSDFYCVAHVGDCRMYHFSQGALINKTSDDSILQVLIDSGRIAEFETYHHPDQSKLTQALGSTQKITPHLDRQPWSPGDSFLLCCDGFWQELHPNEILTLATAPTHEIEKSLQTAVQTAISRAHGTSDNVTAMLYSSIPRGFISKLLNQIFH